MKRISSIFLIFISLASYSQRTSNDSSSLTVSPNVDQEDVFNKQIITTLSLFLQTKDSSYTGNKYWLKSDFEKYIAPYSELAGIERGRSGRNFYKPSLMEIVLTSEESKRIIKVAFIGHHDQTNSNLLKAIYNLVATRQNDSIIFSKYLDYVTQKWKTFREESITYKISPSRSISVNDVVRQKKDVAALCKFLNTTPIRLTYYSCITPKEAFELKGFDYHPMMYIDTVGGFAEGRNIIISGSNSEYYTHELTHIYVRSLFPSIIPFFNEGFATFTGGSGKYGYEGQKHRMKEYLDKNPGFKFEEHTDPYERLFFMQETSIPYVIGALVCERTLRLYGKAKLFDLLKSNKDVFEALRTVGLTKENINTELREEMKLPPIKVLQYQGSAD